MDKTARLKEATVHMGLGREVNDGVDLVFPDHLFHQLGVADIPAHKLVPGILSDVAQVVAISCIGEFVIDHYPTVGVPFQLQVDEVAPDEASSASYQQPLQARTPPPGAGSCDLQSRPSSA